MYMTIETWDESERNITVSGDYEPEVHPTFYYKDGSGDPGAPAEYYLDKIERDGVGVTKEYDDAEREKIEARAFEACIEKFNDSNDYYDDYGE